ncbi:MULTISPECIES: ABC transporter ATP-binding protein [unclassified Rhodococcus (in: high G+C Gram-positive bacteria)]|uniref:ABC transporter ATP-binding protein n=1 Tax=unclassified Rhodococcus (in: high G+C Gram-positive bacteria) TaxID=192944 RepID=UPI00163953EC|nr:MULTISPECIES: ABC transporter ATP-binding protein [unclassified Rhodococcus (in: high G+C Gram-positive bacteria)]MBC2644563.1 ABC transporter ATP-binding protein [Rhodococcus sp. 3A]MBC2897748.1 ABC transporter ATP-binding protein [Rhodococcus sp. 4CII]
MGEHDPVLRCRGLTRIFGSGRTTRVAVDDVTVEVPRAARIAVTGPSGSGKSTLLHLFAALDTPSAGALSWPALDVDPRRDRTRIGVVFQAPSLIPELDVTENVALPLILAGCPDTDARARAVSTLARLGLESVAHRLPDELSGGQLHRVAMARALAGAPRLVLADEPTGQLDHHTGAQVLGTLFGIVGALGAALVLSTHDDAVARRFPVRWSMRNGRIDTRSTPGRAAT